MSTSRIFLAPRISDAIDSGLLASITVCPICRNPGAWCPDDASPGALETYDLYCHKLEALKISAAGGCPYCELLWNVVIAIVPDRAQQVQGIGVDVKPLLWRISPGRRPMCIRIEEDSETLASATMWTHDVATTVPGLENLGSARTVAGDAADEACLEFIENQLARCALHEKCPPRSDVVLPTRVLKIGQNFEDLSLIESKGLRGRYAAVSYCWGEDGGILKTTSSTKSDFQRKIPFSHLPKTLQDAVKIAHELGLSYVWIDSLCIIQDSRPDWEMESSKMHQYYGEAFVTIAATHATDATAGIFGPRDQVSAPRTITFRSGGMAYDLLFQSRGNMLWGSPEFEFGPLAKRAWTFQEHVLSPRIVHFTKSEVIWECGTEMLSEDGHPLRNNSTSLVQDFLENGANTVETSWRLLVRAFSARKLTYTSDKLPAIGGIAQYLQRLSGYTYMAGLWRETMPQDLTWFNSDQLQNPTPPEVLDGPSWTWASIHAPVAFPAEDGSQVIELDPPCTVRSVQCSITGVNPFGEVRSGRLELTGPMMDAVVRYDGTLEADRMPFYRLSTTYGRMPDFGPDTLLEEVKLGGGEKTVRRTRTLVERPFNVDVKCLWCFSTADAVEDLFDMPTADGIKREMHGIVLANANPAGDTYRRIGYVLCQPNSGSDMASVLGFSSRSTVIVI